MSFEYWSRIGKAESHDSFEFLYINKKDWNTISQYQYANLDETTGIIIWLAWACRPLIIIM